MIKLKKIAVMIMLVLLLGMNVNVALAEAEPMGLTILFTHDTHDHFYPDVEDKGGYVRLAALLKEERANAEGAVVTLDGGDFSMGSLFQTIYTSAAPELRALGAMGYDAVTLGNHEFDYRQNGLAKMLDSAKKSGDKLPAIVQANYRTPKDSEKGADVVKAMENYPVTDYVILEKETFGKTIRIAVFGLLGVDADMCSPMSDMEFEPVAEAAKRVISEIKEKEEADFIICLSHTGTEEGKGEDYQLAKEVDGIDVIVSGHTHTTLSEPIRVKDTVIVSAGDYTEYLGRLNIQKENGKLTVTDYQLIPVDNTIVPDPEMEILADEFETLVEEEFLKDYGLGYDEVLADVRQNFTIEETGNLIDSAYISAVKKLEGNDYIPIAFAVAPDGVIRDKLREGKINTAAAFDILSLGSGGDGTPTYPLVSVYLTGKDLKNTFEVDASISMLMPAATLYGAGVHWSYNANRMILDKVTDSELILENGGTAEIDDDKLYRVVADLYSGQMLGAVESKSFGILTVTPRDENGEPITDLEKHILKFSDGVELKAWYALASYLKDEKNISTVESCKTVSKSLNPIALLTRPGVPTIIAIIVGLVVIGLIVLIVRFIIRRRRRRNYLMFYGK